MLEIKSMETLTSQNRTQILSQNESNCIRQVEMIAIRLVIQMISFCNGDKKKFGKLLESYHSRIYSIQLILQ